MKKIGSLLTAGLLLHNISMAQVPITSDNISSYAQPLENQRLSTSNSPTFTGVTATGYNTGNILRVLSSGTDLWDISTGSNTLSFYGYNGTSFATSLQLNRNGNASFAGTVSASEINVNGGLRTAQGSAAFLSDYWRFSENNYNTLNVGYNTNGITDGWINYRGYLDGFTQPRNFNIGNGKSGVIAWFDGINNRVSINNNQVANYTLDVNGTGNFSGALTGYSASFNGTVRTRKIIVTQSGWPDYVFDSSYTLTPLSQVEQYIKSNKHLPDAPSAKEVANKGLNIGDNQALLLKKIEELTLYIINQEKRIKQLEEKIKQ